MRGLAVLLLALGLGGSAAADPRVDYMLQCQGCHLPDGAGTPGAVPALKDSVGRFLRVAGGREFLVRVPGSAQSPLDDARLAAVLNWILASFDPEGLPEGFVPFGAEEVARLRGAPLTDVAGARRELLARLEAPGADSASPSR